MGEGAEEIWDGIMGVAVAGGRTAQDGADSRLTVEGGGGVGRPLLDKPGRNRRSSEQGVRGEGSGPLLLAPGSGRGERGGEGAGRVRRESLEEGEMRWGERGEREGRAQPHGSPSPSPPGGRAGVHVQVHVPFRQSALTRVLSDAFSSSRAMIYDLCSYVHTGAFSSSRAMVSVLATVSPGSSDTEHSLHTLATVAAMASLDGFTAETRSPIDADFSTGGPTPPPPPPKEWSRVDLLEWLVRVQHGKFAEVAEQIPATMDGKLFTRMPRGQFGYRLCAGDAEAGGRLFDLLHHEIEAVALLKSDYHILLRNHQLLARPH
ncbi:hypothetical protein T492DRAFT_835124 [Pavlovales sp. CCMP2436]|nr:hypothetical protein T492DRAFT_835124 [Pavlovales sp. CCMP2436]